MRKNGVLSYLHGDHLGSASLATTATGAKVPNSDLRYLPYGGTRPGFEASVMPTDCMRCASATRESSGLSARR